MTKQKISYCFDTDEITNLRDLLLQWYNKNKRDLPWRRAALNSDKQEHAYAVWVSEIMLQQTRVATVIEYYNRWMSKWPTLSDLAESTLDQVNEVWAGLGYYSRGRRLHEGALKVMNKLDGQIPDNAADLMKELSGVGRYTAAAIASIAFNESVGVLDGNVIRVLCRLLTIGGDVSSKNVLDHLWSVVDDTIPKTNPGDFNQAMMELGALICTPKSPACEKCPLREICQAYKQVIDYRNKNSVVKSNAKKKRKAEKENLATTKKSKREIPDDDVVEEIESCADFLSLPPENPWDPQLGVTNYPRKAEKKPPRQETAFISIVEMKDEDVPPSSRFLITQRPNSGLLAGLWEFPTLTLSEGQRTNDKFLKFFANKNSKPSLASGNYVAENMDPVLGEHLVGHSITSRNHVDEFTHIFSHIRLRYIIEHLTVVQRFISKNPDPGNCKIEKHNSSWKWVVKEDLSGCAMSSAMHKILKLCHPKKLNTKNANIDKKQSKLDSFFVPKKTHVDSKVKIENNKTEG